MAVASRGKREVGRTKRKLRIFIFNLNFVFRKVEKKNGYELKYGGLC